MKAVALLQKSPYKDKLQNAGLFLKALGAGAPSLRALIRPHFGDGQLYKMTAIVDAAPQLDPGPSNRSRRSRWGPRSRRPLDRERGVDANEPRHASFRRARRCRFR